MLEMVKPIAEWSAAFMEVVGISIIVLLALYSMIYGFVLLLKKGEMEIAFREIRQRLGQGILLGLEFLVAADIIYTVAVELTFKTVGVLAIIVVVRTFLSFSLELELTGSWPWQRKE
jgi:uncharacterized membrane protein